ncbi:hypothetical protein DCS_05742 [Drechmeria coniospora]|uniref:GAR domain-containing protein n=1 Tax=Drechmeria coniospora TaxID=98403 RepID=A0A151GNN8_DRECN|nr:hypothetical protein DCS_05742 [Drechmeria coniospora]KYK58725.1 hypothetical protein DCS_05742 [Drechmeria coniospora]ODA84089.1 hypothetical protein RJ55_02607 [Drechmeria coniospora]
MTDPPLLFDSEKRHTLIGGHPTTRQRAGDDLLARLAPPTAAEALASASGSLEACLDEASAAERAFAMRVALASKNIWEWLQELSNWSWPAEGGSAGFEQPRERPTVLPVDDAQSTLPGATTDEFIGSLLASDVARYEMTVERICREMDELALEEIKNDILNHHIMPLAGPTMDSASPSPSPSPSKPSRLSSLFLYNRMEDLTAVVTVIVLQMLPNLARLSLLLQTWIPRLAVVRRIPPLLHAIEDAEVGLKSGWAAIARPAKRSSQPAEGEGAPAPALKHEDFDVMRRVLVRKVTKLGRIMDHMLDCLEGTRDALPGNWLDRTQAVETNYAEWVVFCENKIREGAWASAQARPASQSPVPAPVPALETRRHGSQSPLSSVEADDAVTSPVSAESSHVLASPTSGTGNPAPVAAYHSTSGEPSHESPSPSASADEGSADGHANHGTNSSPKFKLPSFVVYDEDLFDDVPRCRHAMTPVEERDELELPPLRSSDSCHSLASQTSSMGRDVSSHFATSSSEPPEGSDSPVMRNGRIREPDYPAQSPPSSPPMSDESSSALLDGPDIALIPGKEESVLGIQKGSADESFVDHLDDADVPAKPRADGSADQHLRRQISQIVRSIPVKIKLSTDAPAVNLNPPDIQLPPLVRKTSREPFRRSPSALSTASSRTSTPSFTLAPARNPRPRPRGQQDIEEYHLSPSTGEPPIKLFIRSVGERGERVMVRVGGGWADLSEYLKEYASHHRRRSAGTEQAKVDVRDSSRASSAVASNAGSSPPGPSSSVAGSGSEPMTPLVVRKTRKNGRVTPGGSEPSWLRPRTPAGVSRPHDNAPSSAGSARSGSSPRPTWVEDDGSFLGLAGPTGKRVEMSEENKAWVESVKEKVRLVSGERRLTVAEERQRLGDLGKVGSTQRLFFKPDR